MYNQVEFKEFFYWFKNLKIKHKVLIAGNHDRWSLEKYNIQDLESEGIIYLENSDVTIEGIKIWGSPITPTYGNWFHMRSRDKLNKLWENIPEDTDIVVTHGPSKGFLDLSYHGNILEFCGCNALKSQILNRIKPKYHLFGHIHSDYSGNCLNEGIRIYNNITFINGSCVTDGKISKGITSNGTIITIKKKCV